VRWKSSDVPGMSLEQGLYLYSDLLLIYYIDRRDRAKDTEEVGGESPGM
jgi:hypothetical protein